MLSLEHVFYSGRWTSFIKFIAFKLKSLGPGYTRMREIWKNMPLSRISFPPKHFYHCKNLDKELLSSGGKAGGTRREQAGAWSTGLCTVSHPFGLSPSLGRGQ